MSKKRIKVGIYASAFLALGLIAIASDLANIVAAFPQYDPNKVITLVVSSTCIMMIPTTIVTGKLIDFFPKRNMMIIGIVIWLVAGVLPYFLTNIWLIFVCRGLFGVGVGMIQTLVAALVVQHFEDPVERDKVMGAQMAFQQGGGILFALLCGILSNYGWNMAFLTHLVGIPSLILCILCVPNDKPARAIASPNAASAASAKPKFKPSAVMWLWAFGFMVYVIGTQTYGNYTASAIVDMGIGGSTQAATAMIGYAIGGFLFGFVFGKASAILKRFTFLIGAIVYAIGFMIIGLGPSLILSFIGSFISGAAYSICMPCALNSAANSVDQSSSEMATSIVNCGLNLGATLNPIVIGPASSSLLGLVSGITVNQFAFVTSSVLIIAIAIVMTFVAFSSSRKKADQD